MKRIHKLLSIVLVLALAIGLAVPAAAAPEQGLAAQHLRMQRAEKSPGGADVYVYPFASTLDAAVVKGGSTVLQFQRYEASPRSDDILCVEIYKGSVDSFLDSVYAGKEPTLVETREYPMSKFTEPSYALGMTWTADSRYSLGDYTLAMLVISADGGHYEKDTILFDLHVVGKSIPATGIDALMLLDGNYVDMPTVLHGREYLCIEPYLVPYNNTSNRKITATSSKPEIASINMYAGYANLYGHGIGWTTITFTCGNISRSFELLCGADDARGGKLTATNPNLCIGMTDKAVFEYETVFCPVSLDWYSTNPAVVTVKDGVVTAVGLGTAKIVVSGFGYDDYAVTYTVSPHELPAGTPVTERTATKPEMSVGHCSNCGQENAVNIFAPASFTDTDYKAWYSDHVDYVYDKGIMNGTGIYTFAPDTPLTRAMVVTVLYRIAGEPPVSFDELPFTDVLDNVWYSRAVLWASQNGIVNGVGNNRFAPDDNITREQIATILYRYSRFTGIELAEGAELTGFPDCESVADFAQEGLSWAVAEELISGTVSGGVTYLSPKASATRAQFATIISRYQQMFQDAAE